MNLSFDVLSCDLLKTIRDKRSFADMDRLLKLGSNQYRRWESGKVQIKWDDFVIVCKQCQVPLKQSLEVALKYKGNPFQYQDIIKICIGKSNYNVIAKNLKVSRFVIQRWMACKNSPSLKQMLQIIYYGTTRLSTFVKAITADKASNHAKDYLEKNEIFLQLLEEAPWLDGLMCALDLQAYKNLPVHDVNWLSQFLKMPVNIITKSLEQLEAVEFIKKGGSHYKTQAFDVDPSVLNVKAKRLLSYWMNRNLEAIGVNYPSVERKSLSSYHVFNVNTETAAAIKNLYIDFTKNLALLITNGQSHSSEVYAMTISMINFEELVDQK
jgi:hypothetical protein